MYLFLCLILLTGCHHTFDVIESKCEEITIHVSGAVKEGDYTLSCEATFAELLEVIELSSDADVTNYQKTMPLFNNDEIVIRHKQNEIISINTGTIEELVKLKGIGIKTAQKIIDYRNENGMFIRIEDLMKVKGIGEKKFAAIKEQISL